MFFEERWCTLFSQFEHHHKTPDPRHPPHRRWGSRRRAAGRTTIPRRRQATAPQRWAQGPALDPDPSPASVVDFLSKLNATLMSSGKLRSLEKKVRRPRLAIVLSKPPNLYGFDLHVLSTFQQALNPLIKAHLEHVVARFFWAHRGGIFLQFFLIWAVVFLGGLGGAGFPSRLYTHPF